MHFKFLLLICLSASLHGENVKIVEASVYGIFPVKNTAESIQEQLNIEKRLTTRHAVFIKGINSGNIEINFEIPIIYFEQQSIPNLFPEQTYDFQLEKGVLSSNVITKTPTGI
jgi:hypothetical protein